MTVHIAENLRKESDADIVILACTECTFRGLTHVARCLLCGSAVETRKTAPIGTVWSHTFVHLPYEDDEGGYHLVYVDLDEGPRILCRVHPNDPAVEIDDRVTVQKLCDADYTVSEVTV